MRLLRMVRRRGGIERNPAKTKGVKLGASGPHVGKPTSNGTRLKFVAGRLLGYSLFVDESSKRSRKI